MEDEKNENDGDIEDPLADAIPENEGGEKIESKEEEFQLNFNLFQETRWGLLAAFLMFCIPDLRDLARKGELELPDEEKDVEEGASPTLIEKLVDLPITLEEISILYNRNKETITRERLKCEERAEMYGDALGAVEFRKWFGEEKQKEILSANQLVVFSDHHQENDIVYAISVSPVTKRISVIFRGSVTPKDFRQDAKALLSGIDNPVFDKYPGLTEELGVHLGFREYLFKEEDLSKVVHRPRMYRNIVRTTSTAVAKAADTLGFDQKRKSDTSDTNQGLKRGTLEKKKKTRKRDELEVPLKYDVILGQVLDLMEEYPDCRLYIAGHSLGGALSTLFSFLAAADSRVPGPVTCITSGAPKVGNIEFLRAYVAMERAGRIRCLQVANDQDPVPKAPPNGFMNPCHALFCQSRIFRHVGIHLELREAGYALYYPPKTEYWPGIFLCDCAKICKIWLWVLFVFPFISLCFTSCFVIAVPCTLWCIFKTLRVSRQHHTQVKYLTRLDYSQSDLERYYLDELNEMRWSRPRLRAPILHIYSNRTWYGKKMKKQ